MASSNAEKTREIRLRRAAARQGLTLSRSRRRDPRAIGYGRYYLTQDGTALTPSAGWDLTEIEEFLFTRPPHTTEETTAT